MPYDFIVVGGGISGAAAAHALAALGSVALVEAETSPGYHATGRSAALFTRNYGSPAVRAISAAGEAFLRDPPDGFCDGPLLRTRGSLTVAPPGGEDALDALLALSTSRHPIERLGVGDALDLAPLLRPERVAAAAWEPGVADIDVAALHQGYLRALRRAGGVVLTAHRVDAIAREAGLWRVTAGPYALAAPILVNAAGAWADEVGAMAGARPIGIEPRRRTAIVVDAPEGVDVAGLPAIDFAGVDAYLKPEAGRIMASPGDATPDAAHDVRPDEMDVALLVDWLERETQVRVRRIHHAWAGLRSFVADGDPVVGFDEDGAVPSFLWLAGQGGYGIMMAPALARVAAGLIETGRLPDDLAAAGLTEAALAAGRCRSMPVPATK